MAEETEPNPISPQGENRKKIRWSGDKLLGISALIISLSTAVVLSIQTRLMHDQQRKSVLPYFSIGNVGTGSDNYAIILKNDGIGPGIISEIEARYNGKTYPGDLVQTLFTLAEGLDTIPGLFHSNVYEGMLIPSSTTIELFEATNYQSSSLLFQSVGKLYQGGFTFKLVYEDLYGQKRQISESSLQPEPLQ